MINLTTGLSTLALTLPYPEHLGPTYGAYTLSCWFAILHSYGPSISHFSLCTTFDTVCLHLLTSLFSQSKNRRLVYLYRIVVLTTVYRQTVFRRLIAGYLDYDIPFALTTSTVVDFSVICCFKLQSSLF